MVDIYDIIHLYSNKRHVDIKHLKCGNVSNSQTRLTILHATFSLIRFCIFRQPEAATELPAAPLHPMPLAPSLSH